MLSLDCIVERTNLECGTANGAGQLSRRGMTKATNRSRVLIIGGGFGGLYAAKSLKRIPVDITLIDKRNFHLFQPLLYQVATGGLSPGDIASPLRSVLKGIQNIHVINDEVVDIDPTSQSVQLNNGKCNYDMLVLATGVENHYYGNEEWSAYAPSLKTVEDALEIRRRILQYFETEEKRYVTEIGTHTLRIVVVGGGATGVELSGAIAELTHETMRKDFRHINPVKTEIVLIESSNRLLPSYPSSLSSKAALSLGKLGVTTRLNTTVMDINKNTVVIGDSGETERLTAGAIFWTAGIRASSLGSILSTRTGVALDDLGRLIVESDLTLPGHPEIMVIGDLANFSHQTGAPLPGVAPVAIQQGKYVAKLIRNRLLGRETFPFRYKDKGNLAVIGRNAAVADFGFLKVSGYLAWILWVFVHIWYLIGFDNKFSVLIQWAWDYLTRKRGARLIVGDENRAT